MSEIPKGLYYSSSHEWVHDEGDDVYTIGITDHAQCLLGDIVYIELPGIGEEVEKNTETGVVESVKAASDVYSPITGEVIEINEALIENPELVNEDPYGVGWLFRIKALEDSPCTELLGPKAYAKQIASEAH